MGARGVLLHASRCRRPSSIAPPGASTTARSSSSRLPRKVGADDGRRLPGRRSAAGAARLVLPVAAGTPEELSPLTYCVPLELLAYHYASTRGLTMLGFDDESRRSLNYHQIFGE